MSGEQSNLNPYQTPRANVADESVMSDLNAELAGRGVRLAAYILDTLFILIVILPIFFVMESNDETALMIAAAVAIVGGIILVAFNIYFLYTNGQSIGKKIVNVKIVRTDGERCGLARIIFLRNLIIGLLGNIPFIGPFISLADPLFIFRDDRRCIHDLIADTKVIVA